MAKRKDFDPYLRRRNRLTLTEVKRDIKNKAITRKEARKRYLIA